MYNDRIVMPQGLQLETLNQLHQGHLGITKCRSRAMNSVRWPLISKQVEAMCNRCTTCAICSLERKESLLTSSFLEYALERVGTDLFELEKKIYIIVVDYFLRWIECRHLPQTTSAYAIEALQSIFNVHSIPDHVISDNGPQYSSDCFKAFSEEYGFVHITSSPLYPPSNGEAELAVQTAKSILKKNTDPHLGFLAYHATPLHNGQSPAEHLMRRTLCSTVTQDAVKKYPTGNPQKLPTREEQYWDKSAQNYNRHHQTIPPLTSGDMVWIQDQKMFGEIQE